jgi:outer membrane protein
LALKLFNYICRLNLNKSIKQNRTLQKVLFISMKNSQTIVNVLLALGLAVLYYLHFKPAAPAGAVVPGKKIVYVNTDSLLNNYQFYKDTQKEFENKGYRLQVDLGGRERALQNELAAIQQRAQSMSQVELQAADLNLKKKGAELQQYSQNAQQKLAEEQSKRVNEIYDDIRDYIKSINKTNAYDFVLGYTKGGGILYANENAEVTAAIIKGLNEGYKSKAPASTAAIDSTKK